MYRTSAVFVGDGSLLIGCAQAYLNAGHVIHCVMTDSAEISEWATSRQVATLPLKSQLNDLTPTAPFDYLFSIANLNRLPQELIGRARKLAINFHDAPLPRYAGLNATSWALMAGETSHGVTWHEMTPEVDQGRIVLQTSFPIDAADTALGLNTRCYESGLASFLAIVRDLSQGDLTLETQRGTGSYFGRAQRPDALATLDFSLPAHELAGLIRALEFGPYPNPLARPKIYLGDDILLVRTGRVPGTASHAAPGTVLRLEADAVHIATGQGDIVLGGCTNVLGQATTAGIAAGALVPCLDKALHDKFAAGIPRIAKGEAFWSQAFASLAPALLPYPRKLELPHGTGGTGTGGTVSVRLRHVPAGARTIAGFFAWLSALTGQDRVSALYCDGELCAKAEGLECWLSPWVPLTLTTAAQSTTDEATERAGALIELSRRAGPYPRDLPLRQGDKANVHQRLGRIGVNLSGTSGHAAAPLEGDFELLLQADAAGLGLELVASNAVFAADTVWAMASHLEFWLKGFDEATGQMAAIALAPPQDSESLVRAMSGAAPSLHNAASCVHEAIAQQAARTPDREAISCQGKSLSYQELDHRVAALAARLMRAGAKPGAIVGICLPRTPELVLAVLAIMKTGAAYLPLDPEYPQERIVFMVEDSKAPIVLTSGALASSLRLPAAKTLLMDEAGAPQGEIIETFAKVEPDSAAYVIYTSGSTGRPKGVVVTHRNLMNFFIGMDPRIPHDRPGRWLAVTSLSFDISVLELCWTLARGFTVVLQSNTVQDEREAPDFSLFYFASDSGGTPQERYKLLLEGAKFADQEGFSAIWTPERHFHAFGGLYPNPAVTSAAIAAITTRLKIRAGSCVLPLHHPIRVAEDWAFVDNISQGRVGVSFASRQGAPIDFAIGCERKGGEH